MTSPKFALDCVAPLNSRVELIGGVRRGLLSRPRFLSPWMFYDSRGSLLFERITHLPEYYLTRTEHGILADSADEILGGVRADGSEPLRVVELGAGTARRTAILLRVIVRQRGEVLYIPIDVSVDALQTACEDLASLLPQVLVEPVVTNYVTHPLRLNFFEGTTLVVYLGSSIGNFSPDEAQAILRNLSSQLRPGDVLLLGTDLVKDESILLDAYDDKEGLTAKFNRNILCRLNRELGADFDPAHFAHRVVWNRSASRIEMHLESEREQRVRIAQAALDLRFEQFETIHTENSYKFTHNTIQMLLEESGFAVEQIRMDCNEWYALALARVRGPKRTSVL